MGRTFIGDSERKLVGIYLDNEAKAALRTLSILRGLSRSELITRLLKLGMAYTQDAEVKSVMDRYELAETNDRTAQQKAHDNFFGNKNGKVGWQKSSKMAAAFDREVYIDGLRLCHVHRSDEWRVYKPRGAVNRLLGKFEIKDGGNADETKLREELARNNINA